MALASSYGTCFGPTGKRGGFSNEEVWEKFEVDFSSDNTAVGTDLDLFIADHKMLVTDFFAEVETAVTSAESTGSISIGIGSGGTNIINEVINTDFNLGQAIVSRGTGVPSYPVAIDRGEKIVLSKAGNNSDPTAGKFQCYFKVKKRLL